MTLTDFLTQCSGLDDLCTISAPVATALELAGLSRREFARDNGGKVLLFEQPVPGTFPIVTNLFGSEARMARILRASSLAAFEQKLEIYMSDTPAAADGSLPAAADSAPLERGVGALTEAALLSDLPALRSWPEESKPYLTLALTVTADPESGSQNYGLYRVQVIDDQTLAINFSRTSGAGQHLQKAERLGMALPVCLVLGCDPLLMWAAAAPLAPETDDIAFCRGLVGEGFQLGAITDTPVLVPESAEMVISGRIIPGRVGHEGPFGNHTGGYVSRVDCPLMQVRSIRHRPGAVLPFTVVGPPPSENIWLAASNEILIRQSLKKQFPEISHLMMPVTTIFHGVTIISVRSASAAKVRQLVDALWHGSLLKHAPLIIIVDDDINPLQLESCWWRVINRLDRVRVYQSDQRTAIDASGVNLGALVKEASETAQLIRNRKKEPGYYPC